MRKLLIFFVIILIILAVLFLSPLAYRLGIVGPHDYSECVKAGGVTNKNQVRFADYCTYRGKSFFGGNI